MDRQDYALLNLRVHCSWVSARSGYPALVWHAELRSTGAMLSEATILHFDTPGRGMTDITEPIAQWLATSRTRTGQLAVLCRHTSASLTIQENAASAVRHDLMAWLDRVAPEAGHYRHDDEGPDDMPAHLRAMLTGVTLTIPVIGGAMALGTWQGIFLIEHRRAPHRRSVALSVIGA